MAKSGSNTFLATGKQCQLNSNIPIVGQVAGDAGIGVATAAILEITGKNTHVAAAPVIAGLFSAILWEGGWKRRLANFGISALSAFATNVAIQKNLVV